MPSASCNCRSACSAWRLRRPRSRAIARSAARIAARRNSATTLADSIGMALLFTIPSSVGLAILGESMIALIYQGGRFRASDTRADRRRAGVLLGRAGRLFRDEDSRARILRAGRCADARCW